MKVFSFFGGVMRCRWRELALITVKIDCIVNVEVDSDFRQITPRRLLSGSRFFYLRTLFRTTKSAFKIIYNNSIIFLTFGNNSDIFRTE